MNQQIKSGNLNIAPIKQFIRPSKAQAQEAVRTLLAWAGEDPSREGLADTPNRVVEAYGELFGGYGDDVEQILSRTFEEVGGYDDIIIVRDIPFFSHCEHHMVPFFGKAHIGYLPNGAVVGLSKLARLVDAYARRFQTQENLTAQIVDAMERTLKPRGIAIMLEAEHMCMSMRGVKKPGSSTLTHRFTGQFAENPDEQNRFFQLISAGKK